MEPDHEAPGGGGPPPSADRRELDLRGGRRLIVRRSTVADVDGLRELFAGLELEDRRRRFFSAYRPDRRFLERLATVPEDQGIQLVAVEVGPEGDGRVVAEAGYRLLPDGDGELAITVARDRRGWLGPYLLDALVEAAARRGVPNLEADVLTGNRQMLALLRWRGDAILDREDLSILRVLVSTTGRTPSWPPGAGHPRVLVEAPGGAWRAGAEARRAGLEVIACPGPTQRHGTCPALRGEPCPLAAAADVIVISHAPDDERWQALPQAHERLHEGVPVCLEVAGEETTSLPAAEGPEIVELVQRLTARPRPGPDRSPGAGDRRPPRGRGPSATPHAGPA